MRTHYTTELKEKLIQRYNSGETVAVIISETRIPRSTFYAWIKESRECQTSISLDESPKRRIVKLQSKIASLEERFLILKSVDCTPQSPLEEKLRCLEALSGQYNVHALCDALEVPRGTYYNHMRRNKKDNTYYAKRREDLRVKIQNIYDEHRQILGAAKIAAILNQQNEHVSVEMVREIMRGIGLISIREGGKKTYDKESRKYHNHLNQNFHTDQPNQVWVSDVTYFRYGDKQYYICVVIDLFARKVVAYKTGYKNSTQLLRATVKQAVEMRNPPRGMMLHTDRGGNYRSKVFAEYLKSVGIVHSFSRAYVPYDNSVVESFFSNLKREELYRTKYRSERELRKAIDDYMVFYNEKRPHAKLKYKTPNQKELEYAEKVKELS